MKTQKRSWSRTCRRQNERNFTWFSPCPEKWTRKWKDGTLKGLKKERCWSIIDVFATPLLLNTSTTLVLKSVPYFAPCASWAQAQLKMPRLGEAKPTTRGVTLRCINALHAWCAQCTSFLGWVINLCLIAQKRNKTRNTNLLEYEVRKILLL